MGEDFEDVSQIVESLVKRETLLSQWDVEMSTNAPVRSSKN